MIRGASRNTEIILPVARIIYHCLSYEGESIKNQPNLFLGENDLFFFNVIAL